MRLVIEYEPRDALVPLADVTLTRGTHRFAVRPGADQLVLAPARPRPPVIALDAADARALCGRALEWVEALG